MCLSWLSLTSFSKCSESRLKFPLDGAVFGRVANIFRKLVRLSGSLEWHKFLKNMEIWKYGISETIKCTLLSKLLHQPAYQTVSDETCCLGWYMRYLKQNLWYSYIFHKIITTTDLSPYVIKSSPENLKGERKIKCLLSVCKHNLFKTQISNRSKAFWNISMTYKV